MRRHFPLRLLAMTAALTAATATWAENPKTAEMCEAELLATPSEWLGTDMNLRVDEPGASHVLFRQGKTAAHIALRSGAEARVLGAFPAGNSGVALWLRPPDGNVNLEFASQPETLPETPLSFSPNRLRGVRFELRADRDLLLVEQAVLGSVRHIRDWEIGGSKSAAIAERRTFIAPTSLFLDRRSRDGKSYYRLSLSVKDGTIRERPDGRIELRSARGGSMRISVAAESADPPLTPVPVEDILKPELRRTLDARSARLFSFLMYREKFLAGSWIYLTYFGRDTLMTLRLLQDALKPEAIEAMLGSVITRLGRDGRVAHEETIGDYADGSVYDYKMIDDDFMLPAVLWNYVKSADPARMRTFWARRTEDGRSFGEAVAANLNFVLGATKAFARHPSYKNLIGLPDGQPAGQWRDSHEGLGGGKYPYDVNVALAPAGVRAASHLYETALPIRDAKAAHLWAHAARHVADVWEQNAERLFRVTINRADAEARAEAYASANGLATPSAPGSAVSFSALALDAEGKPVPVMHSDEGFRLLFDRPDGGTLARIADNISKQFPYGLLSPVGLLIANPAFADGATQTQFSPAHYHGAVVWSWQQALMAAGLRRQLERPDLSAPIREKLAAAERALWQIIHSTRSHQAAELWTWKASEDGHMIYAPYGRSADDHTESNPNQGWSHAYLGLHDPT